MRRCGDLGMAGGCAPAPLLQARGSWCSGLPAAALQASAPNAKVAVGPGRRDGPRGAVREACGPRWWRGGCLGETGRGQRSLGAAWMWPRGEPGRHPLGRQGAGQRAARGRSGGTCWRRGVAAGPPTGQVRSPPGGSGSVRGPSTGAWGGAVEPICGCSEGLGCRHLAMSGQGLGAVA